MITIPKSRSIFTALKSKDFIDKLPIAGPDDFRKVIGKHIIFASKKHAILMKGFIRASTYGEVSIHYSSDINARYTNRDCSNADYGWSLMYNYQNDEMRSDYFPIYIIKVLG